MLLSSFGSIFGYSFYLFKTQSDLEILMLKEQTRILELKILALEKQSEEALKLAQSVDANSIHVGMIIAVGTVVVGMLLLVILFHQTVPVTDYAEITRLVNANSHRLTKSFDSKLHDHSEQLIKSIKIHFKEQTSVMYKSVSSRMQDNTDVILNSLDIESANILFQDILLKEATNVKLELCLEIIKELKTLEATPANCQVAVDIVTAIAEKIL